MVPSGATPGAELRPARWVPHCTVPGTAVGDGGQGSWLVLKTPRHLSLALGAPGVSEVMVAVWKVPLGATFTSHEFTTSAFHACPCTSSRTV